MFKLSYIFEGLAGYFLTPDLQIYLWTKPNALEHYEVSTSPIISHPVIKNHENR